MPFEYIPGKFWKCITHSHYICTGPYFLNDCRIQQSSEWSKSDPIRSDQIRSDQIRFDPFRSDSIRSDPIRFNQIRSNLIKFDQIRSNTIKFDQIRSNSIKLDQIRKKGMNFFNLVKNQILPKIYRVTLTLLRRNDLRVHNELGLKKLTCEPSCLTDRMETNPTIPSSGIQFLNYSFLSSSKCINLITEEHEIIMRIYYLL